MTTETKLTHGPVTHGYDPRDPGVLAAQTMTRIAFELVSHKSNPTEADIARTQAALIRLARAMRVGNAA